MDIELPRNAGIALGAVAGLEAERKLVVRSDGRIANCSSSDGEPDGYWFTLSSLNLSLPSEVLPGRRDRRERGLK